MVRAASVITCLNDQLVLSLLELGFG